MRRERIVPILWILVSFFFCIESWRLGLGRLKEPGIGLLPFVASLAIGLLATALLLKSGRRRLVESTGPFFQEKGARKIIMLGFTLFAYPLLMSQLGFFLCTLLFVGFTLRVVEPQKWRVVIVVSIGAAIIAYLLFDVLLYVQFPKGRWVDQLLTVITVIKGHLWK